MRIYLDDSSSTASSFDGDIGQSSKLEGEESNVSSGATPNRKSMMQQSSPSSTLLEDGTPQVKRISHLERVSQTRKLSIASKTLQRSRSSTPTWMKSREPSKDIENESLGSDGNDEISEDDVTSGPDSEEGEWPIISPGARLRAKTDWIRNGRYNSNRSKEVAEKIRLSSLSEDVQHLIPRNARFQSQPLPLSSPRRKRLEEEMKAKAKADFDQVQMLLNNLKIKKELEEASERRLFEERNKILWDDIEAGIRRAEEKEKEAFKEEQDRLQRAREQREAAEKRAREAKAAEEAKIQKEREAVERQRQEEEERLKAEAQAEEERIREEEKLKISGVGLSLDREARQSFESWWVKMTHIKTDVLPVISKNTEWRKQCFIAKKSITRGISQLTNSRSEIVRVTQSINDVLTQAKAAATTGEIYTWLLNHLSKCLIRQAEQEVAAKQEAAFPLARVVIWLLLEGHVEFGDVLMARLTKKCCWCLPFCPAKREGQDDLAYAKLIGKTYTEEATFSYTTRMTGIVAFYFAICQIAPSSPPSSAPLDSMKIPTQFRVTALWTWMARATSPRFLNQIVSPAIWSALIEIAGPVLVATYGKQTSKLWRLMLSEGIKGKKAGFTKMQAASSGKVRLTQLLEDYSKNEHVQGATGGRQMNA